MHIALRSDPSLLLTKLRLSAEPRNPQNNLRSHPVTPPSSPWRLLQECFPPYVACPHIRGTLHPANTPQAAARASSLLRTVQFSHPPSCPCHSNPSHHHHHRPGPTSILQQSAETNRRYATPADGPLSKDYAFELAASSIRFGPGVTQEVGKDLRNLKAKMVCVVTDPTVGQLFPMQQVRESLEREGVKYKVFDQVRIEPKDTSYVQAPVTPSPSPSTPLPTEHAG